MAVKEPHLTFGELIETLFQESAKLTRDKKTRTKLVYLALMDMQTARTTVRKQSSLRSESQKNECPWWSDRGR